MVNLGSDLLDKALHEYRDYLHHTSGYSKSTRLEYDDICNELLNVRYQEYENYIKTVKPYRARKICIVLKNALERACILSGRDIIVPKLNIQDVRPIPAWTREEYDKFISKANPLAVRIAKAAFLTGQRVSDLVRIEIYLTHGVTIQLIQQKTGTLCHIPITKELRELIDSTEHKYLVYDLFGDPLKPTTAAYMIKRAIKQLGMRKNLSIHGLRKLSASNMAETGCTVYEIAAVTGHLSVANLQKYTSKYDRHSAAVNAKAKLDAYGARNP
jgi:integrase